MRIVGIYAFVSLDTFLGEVYKMQLFYQSQFLPSRRYHFQTKRLGETFFVQVLAPFAESNIDLWAKDHMNEFGEE